MPPRASPPACAVRWRAWRPNGVWAYVLGLDAPVTELAGAIATLMRALTGSDLPVPLVEM